MQYQHPFDVWSVPVALLAHAQPGQHVYAGDPSNRGRFWGVKKRSGIVVVAWAGNVRGRPPGQRAEYHRTLRSYAKGVA